MTITKNSYFYYYREMIVLLQPVLSEEDVLFQTQLHTARKNCATKASL